MTLLVHALPLRLTRLRTPRPDSLVVVMPGPGRADTGAAGTIAVVSCPCGLGEPYDACCGRFHAGKPAPTAELLMRSRYTAFARGDTAYLLRTWHPTTRPRRLRLDPTQVWTGLEIHDRSGGGLFDAEGVVEFTAHHDRGSQHERSRFVREDGAWTYHS
jgi:SEC-C motif-containing protein